MNEIKNNTGKLERYSLLILIVCLLGFTYSCESIIGSISELPEDIDEGASNPLDPKSDSFVLPVIQFTNSAYSLSAPFTITQRNLSLEWNIVNQNGETVDFEYEFQYRYALSTENISSKPFTILGTERSLTLPNLRETFNNEVYNFEITATYTPTGRDTTFAGQFYVNAFQSRGFLFNPHLITSNTDGTYTAEVYLDEIKSSDDIAAFSLVLSYDQADLNVTDVRVLGDAGSFLNPDGNNTLIYVEPEITPNLITIEAGIAGNAVSLSGGGAVCEITFTPTNSFSGSSAISVHNTSVLKSSEGLDINILQFDQADVVQ